MVDEAVYQRIFAAPLATVRRHCDSDRSREAIDRLERSIRASVEGYTLPMAWTHGDFFLGNCLSDAGGHLTGVVDWELFSTAGLPLLDLLQLMVVPGETSSHPTWQRFDRSAQMRARWQADASQRFALSFRRAHATQHHRSSRSGLCRESSDAVCESQQRAQSDGLPH